MKVNERYKKIFGEIRTLGEEVAWTTGLSNMLEWLTWSTNDVLGVTKTRYRKKILEWAHDPSIQQADLKTRTEFVEKRLKEEVEASEKLERYAKVNSTIATPREALRRAKYFSEDYLNKEFDIYWSLVSDQYLDAFYGQVTSLKGGGRWYTHGNSL